MQSVLMYTSGFCPYCVRAEMLLKQRGVTQIEKIFVDKTEGAREEMMARTERRPVLQIYIGQTHVGGCDDLVALDRAGKLLPMLNEK